MMNKYKTETNYFTKLKRTYGSKTHLLIYFDIRKMHDAHDVYNIYDEIHIFCESPIWQHLL